MVNARVIKCLRKICKIYWPRKITNKDLHVRTGQKNLITVIKQRQFRWLGHVLRKGNYSITKTALKMDTGRGKKKSRKTQRDMEKDNRKWEKPRKK